MAKNIGVLTAGGDSPGLNAAIRGIGKAASVIYKMHVTGFKDGFRGLMENRSIDLDRQSLSGILTRGGTILGTSRDKPHKMPVGGKTMDMTDAIVENYHKHRLDCLVCIGGGGTQKNAFKLVEKGLNIITLPKTIDNDVEMTDITMGFDTALGVATDAIDRLHSTAHSHHRIIVVEIMGHRSGWLALGAGIAGGADVILLPEIPYDIKIVSDSIMRRSQLGSPFSIVAVAEGSLSIEESKGIKKLSDSLKKASSIEEKIKLKDEINFSMSTKNNTLKLAEMLEKQTGLESRVTILGHLQRGGIPSAVDRLLATRLGTACADYIDKGVFGIMVAIDGNKTKPVKLEKVVGKRKIVPLDHEWIKSARYVGTCMGD